MNTIYLVRHGENLANVTKEFSYKKVDYDLNDKGNEQALQTAKYFKDFKIDYIYSSPLKRAIQTAKYISEELKIDSQIIEDFREVNVGDLEGQKPDKAIWDIYFTVTADWYSGKIETKFPNGENYTSLVNRFYEGLKIVTQNKSGKNIIVAGHGGIFTAGIIELCSIQDKKEFLNNKNHNCSITEIQIKNINNNLSAKLIKWADNSHLTGNAAEFTNGLPEKNNLKMI